MEVKRHPELTLHGSKFAKRYPNPEGYYTQDDLRELVAYAASRQILIVPEIEMPGHSLRCWPPTPISPAGVGRSKSTHIRMRFTARAPSSARATSGLSRYSRTCWPK